MYQILPQSVRFCGVYIKIFLFFLVHSVYIVKRVGVIDQLCSLQMKKTNRWKHADWKKFYYSPEQRVCTASTVWHCSCWLIIRYCHVKGELITVREGRHCDSWLVKCLGGSCDLSLMTTLTKCSCNLCSRSDQLADV